MKRKGIPYYILRCIAIFSIVLVVSGCAERSVIAVDTENGTTVYPSKDPADVSAEIILFRHNPSNADTLVGEGSVFTIMDDENINAYIELENCFSNNNRDLMFHVDWVTEAGKSFYRKQFNVSTSDSVMLLKSAISLAPDKREPGNYYIQLYLFRELIAEKKFVIKPEFFNSDDENLGVKASITLYRGISRKSGEMVGEGIQFQIKKKRKIRAAIHIENCPVFNDRELIFSVNWLDNRGNTIYHKDVDVAPGDDIDSLSSYISIGPESRSPGDYALQVTLYGKQIAIQPFTILPE